MTPDTPMTTKQHRERLDHREKTHRKLFAVGHWPPQSKVKARQELLAMYDDKGLKEHALSGQEMTHQMRKLRPVPEGAEPEAEEQDQWEAAHIELCRQELRQARERFKASLDALL